MVISCWAKMIQSILGQVVGLTRSQTRIQQRIQNACVHISSDGSNACGFFCKHRLGQVAGLSGQSKLVTSFVRLKSMQHM